ncbi:NAD-dependent epimerase/dehydratase family protein [Escherichia coli]|uniref:NAD-dependent epimerase/dehydratase family protein n=1 Tax=Escherichia coli TaxID=562 RepID=UPI00287F62A7|nr:NAD-dependent epimerase/dehydratase family protein [Escherichia coli]WMZ24115.1 NAD-dependent epimerase/dehydratase family protein [Escherichia coli]
MNSNQTNILITGINGFIGKNLVVSLKENGFDKILGIDRSTTIECIEKYVKKQILYFI